MKNLKERFLDIVSEIKRTGVVEKLKSTTTEEEFRSVWDEFISQNLYLLDEIEFFDEAFRNSKWCYIFLMSTEYVQDPEEVALCIYLLPNLTEDNIFEDFLDLQVSLKKLDNDFATAIANLINEMCIYEIEPRDIFNTVSEIKREKIKHNFINLVEELKITGIVEKLHATINAEKFNLVWNEFYSENENLFVRLHSWEDEFISSNLNFVFKCGEDVPNIEEVIICLHYLKKFKETDLFEHWLVLQDELYILNNNFSVEVADLMNKNFIKNISITEVFERISKVKKHRNMKTKLA